MQGFERDETIIVDKILKFDEFEKFYHIEWEKPNISIKWQIDPLFEYPAAMMFDENDMPFIELKQYPETLDDAFIVAHEMKHVLIYFDKNYLDIKINYPAGIKYEQKEIYDLSGILGDLFDDPIVDSFLQNRYNFNIAKFYMTKKIPRIINSLNSEGDSKDDLYRLMQVFFYSITALQWDSITDKNALRAWHDLRRLYQNQRPVVKGMGDELYSMINEEGYDTVERQKRLFDRIVSKYTIDGILLNNIFEINSS